MRETAAAVDSLDDRVFQFMPVSACVLILAATTIFLRSLLPNCVAMHFKDSRAASDVSRSRERMGQRRTTAVDARRSPSETRASAQAGRRSGTARARPRRSLVRLAVNGNLHCCVCQKARRPSSTGEGLAGPDSLPRGRAGGRHHLASCGCDGRSHHIKCGRSSSALTN